MSEAELKLEIAILLYKRQKISAGKSSEWLEINLFEFRRELGKRGLTINYDVQDFQADVESCTPWVGIQVRTTKHYPGCELSGAACRMST